MRGWVQILFVSLLLSVNSVHANECTELVEELQSMRKAQQTMLKSLSDNHDLFATTLESYSDALSATAGKVHKTVTTNMNESAKSFRQRGAAARLTSAKLDRATSDLISRIEKCVRQK